MNIGFLITPKADAMLDFECLLKVPHRINAPCNFIRRMNACWNEKLIKHQAFKIKHEVSVLRHPKPLRM
jgi:hypothetical protein